MYAQRKEGKETKLRLFRDGRRRLFTIYTYGQTGRSIRWLIRTKHFPHCKTLSRIQTHFPESKTRPRIQKHFSESKTLPRIQKDFPEFWDVFWILGSVFGFWEVFCPYEQPSINGTQNSGLVNFVPESRLPFVQISSIFQKRPRRPEPGFKDGFEDMEHEFQFGIFRPEKTGPPFQMFCCSRKFSDRTTQKVVFHLLSNRIFRKILVNGKQPGCTLPMVPCGSSPVISVSRSLLPCKKRSA